MLFSSRRLLWKFQYLLNPRQVFNLADGGPTPGFVSVFIFIALPTSFQIEYNGMNLLFANGRSLKVNHVNVDETYSYSTSFNMRWRFNFVVSHATKLYWVSIVATSLNNISYHMDPGRLYYCLLQVFTMSTITWNHSALLV